MTHRSILIYLSLKSRGEWTLIRKHLLDKDLEINYDKTDDIEKKLKFKTVTIFDENYPDVFKKIGNPPFVLYYYGDLSLLNNARKRISVVGSREYSKYGEKMTREIVTDLPNDYVVISGLAKGIDAIAHESAIASGKRTVAILGSGIDYCYPRENLDLYKLIKRDHLIISEYPFGYLPETHHFPFRNRLVAALGDGLLVTDAHRRSGTTFTIDCALAIGKTVMCVPHLSNTNSACNLMIKCGAYLVENHEDIEFLMEGKFNDIFLK